MVLEKVPFFALSAASSVITFLAQRAGGAVADADKLFLRLRITNAVVSYVRYIGKMIWPSKLAVFYPHPGSTLPVWEAGVAVLLLTAISVLVIRLSSNRRYLLVGWLWYLVTLAPVIGLVQAGSQALADHFTYVPLTGLFIVIAWGFDDFFSGWRWQKTFLSVSGLIVISAFSISTHFQLHYWRDSITLLEHALRVTGENSVICQEIGVAYGKAGRYTDAINAFKQAVRIRPDYTDAYYNLGVACVEAGRYEEAIEALKEAIRIKPNHSKAHHKIGDAYNILGHYNKAIEAFREAVRINQNDADVYSNLGVSYGKLGRYAEAIEAYKQAIKIQPDKADVYCGLGVAYSKAGKCSEAIEVFKKAIKIKPDYAEAHFGLGVVYLMTGDKNSAKDEHKILKEGVPELADKLSSLISDK